MSEAYGELGDLEEDRRPPPVTFERDAALVDRLTEDPRVRNAAHVAHIFGIDPITVLAEPDRYRRLLRLAAAQIINDEERKAAKREDARAAAAASQQRR